MVILREFTRQINDKEVKFTIKQATEEYTQPVIQHMYDHFLAREPLCSHTKVIEDPLSLNDLIKAWKYCLSHGLGIVALMEIEDDLPVVVGANVTFLKKITDQGSLGKGEAFNTVYEAVDELFQRGNLFEKYGVDKYMSALGLSVHRDFHGLDLGREILRAREPLCRQNGIRLAATVFTASASRYIAKDEGYTTLIEEDYKDYTFNGKKLDKLDGAIALQVITFD